MKNQKNRTVSDIAAVLGLDRTTVSYVLNDRWKERRIAKKTARRVLDYVKEVGFHQDISALSMRGKHSVDVAIIIRPNLYFEQQMIYFRLMEFLDNSELNYVSLSFNDQNYGRFCQELKANNPKKVVVFSYFFINEKLLDDWMQIRDDYIAQVPCYYHYIQGDVSKMNVLQEHDSGSFTQNYKSTFEEALDFLRSKGFEKIFVNSQSFQSYLRKKESTASDIVFYAPAAENFKKDRFYTEKLLETGELIAKELLQHQFIPGKTAVIIHDEYCAVACMNYLRRFDVKNPEDILIVSGSAMAATKLYDYPRLYWQYPFEQMYQHMRGWLEGKHVAQELKGFSIELKNKEILP